jgi:hypothetical protein
MLMATTGTMPMVVGTFTAHSTHYANRRLLFFNQTFTIEGVGPIDPRHLPVMADRGEVVWARQDLDPWVRQWSSYAATNAQMVPLVNNPAYVVVAERRHSTAAAIALIAIGIPLAIVGVLLSLTVIGAVVGVPVGIVGGAMAGVGIRWLAR